MCAILKELLYLFQKMPPAPQVGSLLLAANVDAYCSCFEAVLTPNLMPP